MANVKYLVDLTKKEEEQLRMGTSIYSFGCEVFSVFDKFSRADLIFTSFEPVSR